MGKVIEPTKEKYSSKKPKTKNKVAKSSKSSHEIVDTNEPIPSGRNVPQSKEVKDFVEDQKPRRFLLLLIFMSLFSLYYYVMAVSFLWTVASEEFTNVVENNADAMFRSFPTYGLGVTACLLVALIFLYLGLKLLNGAKNTFWYGVFAILVIPPVLNFVAVYLFKDFTAFVTEGLGYQSLTTLEILTNFDVAFIVLVLVTLVSLIFSYRKFIYDDKPLGKWRRISFTTAIIILIIPLMLAMGLMYSRVFDKDFGYTETEYLTSFHLLSPGWLPEGVDVSEKYQLVNSNQSDEVVSVIYSTSKYKMGDQSNDPIIVVYQSTFEPGIILYDVLKSGDSKRELSEITFENSVDGTALMISYEDETNSRGLAYITDDDIWVHIVTHGLTDEQILKFAYALE